MTNNKMSFKIIAIYIGILIIFALFQAVYVRFDPGILSDADALSLFNSIINLFFYGSVLVVFLLVFKHYFNNQIKDCLNRKEKVLKIVVIGFFLMFAASIVANTILMLLGVTDTSQNQASLDEFSNGTLFEKISLFVFAVLLAPIVEELVFRKAVYGIFERYNYIIAIIISALFFGFMHVSGGDYIQIIYYASLGGILGLLYHYSNNNIIVPMVVHLCFNLFVTTTMFLS